MASIDILIADLSLEGLMAGLQVARQGRQVAFAGRPVDALQAVQGALGHNLPPGFLAPMPVRLPSAAILSQTELLAHGLKLLPPSPLWLHPAYEPRDPPLIVGDPPSALSTTLGLSPNDTAALSSLERDLEGLARFLMQMVANDPDADVDPQGALKTIVTGAERRLARTAELLLTRPLSALLDQIFDDPRLKAHLVERTLMVGTVGPDELGSAAGLVHVGLWGLALEAGGRYQASGGALGLVQALLSALSASTIQFLGAPLARVDASATSLDGVELGDGRVLHPRALLLPPEDEAPFAGPAIFRVTLALAGLPQVAGMEGLDASTLLDGTVAVLPRAEDLAQAYVAAASGLFTSDPAVTMRIPSLVDPGLAPPGQHVALIEVTPVPLAPAPMTPWERQVQPLTVFALGRMAEILPDLPDLVIAAAPETPLEAWHRGDLPPQGYWRRKVSAQPRLIGPNIWRRGRGGAATDHPPGIRAAEQLLRAPLHGPALLPLA